MERTNKKHLGTVDADAIGYLKKGGKSPMTCISLFTGAGGAALGIAAAGFEIRAMVEWDKSACHTLRTNWTMEGWRESHQEVVNGLRNPPKKARRGTLDSWYMMRRGKKERAELIAEHERLRDAGPPRIGTKEGWYRKREPAIIEADITKLPTEEILMRANLRVGEADLLEGGFPCQGFSTANSRRHADDHTKDQRNVLYKEAVRVIREALPKTFMLENVPGLVSMERGRVIRMICDDLAASGYTVTWHKLNAANYGVPQHRVRIFFMGERNDVMAFPESGHPQLHIGGAAGPVFHPDWFEKKYPDGGEKVGDIAGDKM